MNPQAPITPASPSDSGKPEQPKTETPGIVPPKITPRPLQMDSLEGPDDMAREAKAMRDTTMLYVTIGVLAVILIGIGMGVWYVSSTPPSEAGPDTTEGLAQDPETGAPAAIAGALGSLPADSPSETAPADGSMTVDWLEVPAGQQDAPVDHLASKNGLFAYFKLGSISQGSYAGHDLYLIERECDQPCFQKPYYRALMSQDPASRAVLLETASDPLLDADRDAFDRDAATVIPGLEAPALTDIPSSRFRLVQTSYQPNALFRQHELQSVLDTPSGSLYSTASDQADERLRNCLLFKRADGTLAKYRYDIDFVAEPAAGTFPARTTVASPIAWTDGGTNGAEYVSADITGCGSAACYDVVRGVEDSSIQMIGQTSKGDIVFAPKDSADALYKQAYEDRPASAGVSYENFVANRPLFLWKDPAGRWVRFTKAEYVRFPGCG